MRAVIVATAMCLSIVGVSAAQSANAAMKMPTNIPAEGLGPALKEFAQARNLQVLYFSQITKDLQTGGASGELTTNEALTQLLRGTGLTYRYVDDKAVTILPVGTPLFQEESVKTATGDDPNGANSSAQEGKKNSSSGFRAAPVDQGVTAVGGDFSSVQKQNVNLEEVIVTAQKRSEKIVDVPSSIGVISGERLEAMQAYSLTDFAGYVPGLTVAGGGSPGQTTLVIRGLSTGYSNATTGPLVATYIDDIPMNSSTAAAAGALYGVDLMPYDIERVEVLRGPQGTLYGAGAMGGLVKYSLRKPNLSQFEVNTGASAADISGGHGSWGARAAVNLPLLADTLGLRVSGFNQDNAGYIDNVGTEDKNANHSSESGGRATLLWKPVDALSIQGTILAQDIHSDDQTAVTVDGTTLRPAYGSQARSTFFAEPFTQQLRQYSLSVSWSLPFATLTSSSSWSRLDSRYQEDFTPNYGLYVPFPGGGLVQYRLGNKVSKSTEELRLTSLDHQKIQWMLGAFYTKEDGQRDESTPSFTPSYNALPAADNLFIGVTQGRYSERAFFGNATYLITDRFDIGAGARYAENRDANCVPVRAGLFAFAGPAPCTSRPYAGVATWMADARFHLNPSSMLYLRWATGYRPGGCINGCVPVPAFGEPASFAPDRVANYEGGFKGEFLDHRLQLDVSVFHIHWDGIQGQVINSQGNGYTGNGKTAISSGVEMTASFQLTDHLTVQPTLTYTDAKLTADAPGLNGKDGDELPQSPRWSGSILAEYHQPLDERKELQLGGGYRYRDAVNNQLAGTGQPLPMAPQNIVDLYIGLTANRMSARLFAKNVFNNRSYMGLLYLVQPSLPMFVPIQPRTIGVSLDYGFK